MQNEHRKIEQKRKRKLKTSFKIFMLVLVGCIGCSAYVGYDIWQSQHQPDNHGGIGDIDVSNDDSYDLTDEASPEISYTVFDVGKGESILVQCGQCNVLVDTGSSRSGESLVKKLTSKKISSIDYVVLTSSDEGRIGGVSSIYKNFNVGTTIIGELGSAKASVKSLIAGNGNIQDGKDMNVSLGEGCELSIFKPDVSSKEVGDRSLVTYISYGDTGFLALSDAGKEEASRIMPNIVACDVLVLPRFGEKSDVQFPDNLYYRFVVASAVKESGFPNERQKELNAYRYATFKTGDLKFTSNGMSVETSISNDDAL